MFERLQSFFHSLGAERSRQSFEPGDVRVTVAALCFQVMEADGIIRDSERQKLRQVLKRDYALDEEQLDALLAAGEEAEHQAVDYFRFTSELKRRLNEEQREQLLGILWDIVYADGTRSEMEDHAIWRVAELLGVSARERITQRQQAALRAGLDTGTEKGLVDE